jgi:hypothetical protein
MKRRAFLKTLVSLVICGRSVPEVLAGIAIVPRVARAQSSDSHIKDYLHRMRNFNRYHEGDICLELEQIRLLESCVQRFKRLQRTVGHGNFYLLDFDEALGYSRNYTRVGRFTPEELNFLEMIFYQDAQEYGFVGEKPLKNLTDRIQKRKVVKVPGSGNYLYKGPARDTYEKIKQDLGDQVLLTSGVRRVIKQFFLFLHKAYLNSGNLSLASRSLAPPGYSYHGIGDFDVGQIDLGVDNFTERFTTTEVYRKLQDLGYVNIRYTRDNLLGVRFEPWHIKLDS